MLLFADSGASKTSWVITDFEGNKISGFKSIGLNPYFLDSKKMMSEINKTFPENIRKENIAKVFFYGAGCGRNDSYEIVFDALNKTFSNADNLVFSDMLGAARAVFLKEKGIAAILGTGSNACVYNGSEITDNAVTLGFILGDEGSGAHIGKRFVKKYLENGFSKNLNEKIAQLENIQEKTVLDRVYRKPHPNKYLADFCNIVHKLLNEKEIYELVYDSFELFFEKYIFSLDKSNENKRNNIGLCGSIAFHFQDVLRDVAIKHNYEIVSVLKEPIDMIIKFHVQNEL